MSDPKKCAHDRCSCIVSDDKKYCSESCETTDKDGLNTLACDCPHAGCKGHL